MATVSSLRAWLAVAAGAVLLAAAASNCQSGAGESPAPDAGGTGATGGASGGGGGQLEAGAWEGGGATDAGTGGAAEAGEAGACAPPAPNPDVPPGWYAWQGWSCNCPLYLPGPSAAPVEPVKWEACPAPVDPALGCRRMVQDWTSQPLATTFASFGVDPVNGAPLLTFGRLHAGANADLSYYVVTEADGPVRVALLKANPLGQGCDLYVMGTNEGRYAFHVVGDQWTGPVDNGREGVIAGSTEQAKPDRVLGFPQDKSLGRDFYVSADWLVEVFHTWIARSWSSDTPTTIYDPAQDPQHLPGNTTLPRGKDVFIEVGQGVDDQYETTAVYGEMVWTPSAGLAQLLRWPSDPARNAANFGTDGKDMVWIYQNHGTRSVMTAKYSTDPAVVTKTERRLAADPATVFPLPQPFVVGCGYAARHLYTGAGTNDLFVVRLSDGTAWLLGGNADAGAFSYEMALGITCSEIFVQAQMTDNPTAILRIPLSNLGTPLPPS